MNIWLHELWGSWRASLRRPRFLLLAGAVLALGVGVSTAVFSLVDGALLKPLPYADPQRLVAIGMVDEGHVQSLSPEQFQHIQAVSGVEPVGLFERYAPAVNLAGGGTPEQVRAIFANRQLLPTLGVKPVIGRNFSVEEDSRGGPRAMILGHALWMHRFGGDPDVLGRVLKIEGRPRTIVGVLPADFHLVDGDVMLPAALPAVSHNDGTNFLAVARLKPGVSVSAVSAEVRGRLQAMYADKPSSDPYAAKMLRMAFGAEPLASALHAADRPVLGFFLACAVVVLVIALVNLTNLMLLRTLSRVHDAAVRVALGASRLRLAWPALGKGLLVGVLGAGLGLGLAGLGLHLLARLMPDGWLSQGAVRLSPWAWPLALGLGLAGAVLSALLGAWQGRRRDTSMGELREGGRTGVSVRSGRLGRALVVAQVAMAAALLGVAGLFLHTLYAAARTPLGFDDHGIVTFEMAPVQATYPDAAQVQQLARKVVGSLRAQPGVIDAAVTTNLPTGTEGDQFRIGGFEIANARGLGFQFRGVDDNFFRLFHIPVREGRDFSDTDTAGGERVAIVSRSLARHRFGGHALGKTITRDTGVEGKTWSVRIVGVADDTRQLGAMNPPLDTLYLPFVQVPDHELRIVRSYFPIRFALSVHGNPGSYADAIRRAVHAVDPEQPIANIRTMREVVAQTSQSTVMVLALVGLFAALALLLAAAGLYAVMAVAVTAREREFGLRQALGAAPRRLVRAVMREGLLQVGVGLAVGVLMSVGVARALPSVIREQSVLALVDPIDIAGVCVCLALSGLLACLLPALRASRVQPMAVLRGD
ncbi:MAG: ADOP family duplicated permease [Pseudomonadota bacterium]